MTEEREIRCREQVDALPEPLKLMEQNSTYQNFTYISLSPSLSY